MTSAVLPQLLDAKTLAAELGVKRATAEAIMRRLPKVTIEDHRRVFVRREDVRRYRSQLVNHAFSRRAAAVGSTSQVPANRTPVEAVPAAGRGAGDASVMPPA